MVEVYFSPGRRTVDGKFGVVGRIGEVLRLEREPVALAVLAAAGAVQRAVEEVAGVELDPRLGRLERQHAAARRVAQRGRLDEPAVVVRHAG